MLLLSVTCKFRCRSHKLLVNKGQFNANTPHCDMQCTLCLSTDIGDEFHCNFVCPYFQREIRLYLPKELCKIRFPSALHMTELFDTRSTSRLKNLARFTRLIMLQFSQKTEKENCSSVLGGTNRVGPTRTRSGRIVKQPALFSL